MIKSEFIIWKVETMVQIGIEKPFLNKEQQWKLLCQIAKKIVEKEPNFFGEFGSELLEEKPKAAVTNEGRWK